MSTAVTLLVDVGNSRIKWGWLSGGSILDSEASAWGAMPLAQLFTQWQAVQQPQAVLVSNVAGRRFSNELDAWLAQHWSCQARYLASTAAACGVRNAYQQPERLGVDRWASLLAAHERGTGDVCVVDCGTAITIDGMRGDGSHLGGVIMPGKETMRRSLLQNTQGITSLNEHDNVSIFNRDTQGAVNQGCLHAAAGGIDRVLDLMSREMNVAPTVLITGGDAALLQPLLNHGSEHLPDLVLQGLAIWQTYNT